MLLYDISRDIMSTEPYDDDPIASVKHIKSINNGDMYNLSTITMCTHNATHIDAPMHFDEDGANIGKMGLSKFYGKCTLVSIKGILTGEDMEDLLPHCRKRVIFHGSGEAYLSSSAAQVIADNGIILVGTDAPSIALAFDEAKTHMELARGNVAVLENLNLEGVKDGTYMLSAFPIKLSELEAAPCRAVLIEEGKGI